MYFSGLAVEMINNDIVIKLENISKVYKLYRSHSHRLLDAIKLFKGNYSHDFWALKDISFEIPRGTTVGILGQNGSGKSTLLQLITSVLQPTHGKISVKGRVAALLELGAGFNPSLTGRENVIMNGMMMGCSKEKILEKLDQIQAFADIGDFFFQPMKIYSSGMFMRVAFAAAIHVDPDILIIDEALSVGDAKFQEKCFRRFRQFQEEGKTIILVTHDRSAVPRLCNLALLLNRGKLIEIGSPKKIVNLYSNILATGDIQEIKAEVESTDDEDVDDSDDGVDNVGSRQSTLNEDECRMSRSDTHNFLNNPSSADLCSTRPAYNKNEYRYGDGKAKIIDYFICTENNANITTIQCNDVMEVYLKVIAYQDIKPLVGLSIRDSQGVLVCGLNSDWLKNRTIPELKKDQTQYYKFSVRMNLKPGSWFLEFAIASSQSDLCDIRTNMVHLEVLSNINSFDGLVFLENDLEVLV